MSNFENTLDEQNEWLTAQQAAKLLRVKPNRLHYYVKTRNIAIEPGSIARHRRYSRADVMKLAREFTGKQHEQEEKILIDWIQPGDIPAALKMLQKVYNTETVNLAEIAVYESWRKNNNQLSLGAFSPDRQTCYGSIQLVPLPESVILDILSGKRDENSIQPDEVRPYNEPGPYDLLGTNAAALSNHPRLLYRLLDRYMDFWVEMYPERYINKVYAQVVSEPGERLVQLLFMTPLQHLAENAFRLDLQRPTVSRAIRKFKAKLKAKQK